MYPEIGAGETYVTKDAVMNYKIELYEQRLFAFATMAVLEDSGVCSSGKFILVLCTLRYLFDLLVTGTNSMHVSIETHFLQSNWAQLRDELRQTDLRTQQAIVSSNDMLNLYVGALLL